MVDDEGFYWTSGGHQLEAHNLDELHELNGKLAFTEAGQRHVFYQQQLDAEREALAQAEVVLKQMEEKSGLIQIGRAHV